MRSSSCRRCRIRLCRGQLARLLGVALGEADQRLRADAHGLELFLLGVGLRVVQEVELRQARVDVG